LKVPAKPETVKAKSIYGLAFGDRPIRSRAASAVTRAWEWLGVYRSDLDLAWVRRVSDGELLDNVATRRIGGLINRRSGVRSFRHGSHATAGPAGHGPLSAEDLGKIGEPGGAIAYTSDGMEALSATRTRDLFKGWGRYHDDWAPVGPKSLFQSAAPSSAVSSAHRIHAAGKDRNDK
jgi:hypothetical protein